MKKPIVFMFSGQGSQFYQMGRELFNKEPVFKEWMIRLNNITQEMSAISIIDRLYSEKRTISEQFDQIIYTHPAIFMVEYAMAQVLLDRGIFPNVILGTSLGEFTAAVIAGFLSVYDALEAVIKQAHAINTYCQKGKMIAIIHDFSLYKETPIIYKNSELASVNFDSHFVISGGTSELDIIEEFLESKGIIYQTLPVSYGFHSPSIDSAENYFKDFLRNVSYKSPYIPFVSCLSGTFTTQLTEEYFWDTTRQPIKFPRAIRELEGANNENLIYLDLGPGGTLANFTKRIIDTNTKSKAFALMTPYNQDLKNLSIVKDVCHL